MATIQLLLTDDPNRRALAALVEQRHALITDAELQDADLYLVDDASLPQYQGALEARKRDQYPVFCPVVLIRRSQTPVRVDLPPSDAEDRIRLIDELVTAPVERHVLFRRIANLVSRRNQTVELNRHNERLEQLASMLRHEVRNPLAILDGYLTLAQERGDPESFERCHAAVDRMQRLFDETLLIVQGAPVDIETEPVELRSICEDAWAIISDSEARLELATSQRILANESRLRQLIENLFRNAVEHGGRDVTVTVGDLEDGFYVADDGVGIPPDERDVVFESGYSTCGAGTGLGLEVVEHVGEVHGWDVRITDGPAGGARFEIRGVDRA